MAYNFDNNPSFFDIQSGMLEKTYREKDFKKHNNLKSKLKTNGYKITKYNSHLKKEDGVTRFNVELESIDIFIKNNK